MVNKQLASDQAPQPGDGALKANWLILPNKQVVVANEDTSLCDKGNIWYTGIM